MDKQYLFSLGCSIICSLIAGISSYLKAMKETKTELQKMEKQNEYAIELERERHRNEIEKLEVTYKHELELKEKEYENKLSSDMTSAFMTQLLHTPEVQQMISDGMRGIPQNNPKRRNR